MAAEEHINFTVRPLPRGTSLEGAFRVHIASKDLEALKIRPGDLCQLNTAEGTTGTGIAWRSTDVTAKANTHPVKLTDTFRDAFNFKLGNQLTISRSQAQIYHADRVVVTDVSDHDTSDEVRDDENWNWRCGNILGNVEAIANGIAFEATSRKGLRKRFLIESINSSTRDSNALYFFNDRTQLILQDESAGPTPAPRMRSLRLSKHGIGGLDQQIGLLNERLDLLVGEIDGRRLPVSMRVNDGILLYGPTGTGKSLILKRLAQGPWRKVLRINSGTLPGTPSRIQSVVAGLITEAIAQQPSLILMDNIHIIAGSQPNEIYGQSTVDLIAQELERLNGTKVLVVAAAPNPSDVNKTLRAPGLLEYELEIPIPDQAARISILKTLQDTAGEGSSEFDELAETIGGRTHGFVGQDLRALYRRAQVHAIRRFVQGGWSSNSGSHDAASLTTLVNGHGHGHAHNRPSVSTLGSIDYQNEAAAIDLLMEDFEKALLEIRPTAMKEVFLETPNVQWSQIGGSHEIKRLLTRAVEWPLKHSFHMDDLDMSPTKGILLYGPPGCSKTMTAKAVATSSGLNFLAVKGAELTSMYVGESERAIREVFRKARVAAPSIIFFDEIDSIATERDASSSGLNVLTTLLNEMDGIESLNGVLVLAATNKPEILDAALLRPGRFDTLHYIGPPNLEARKEIFRLKTSAIPVSASVNTVGLAQRTEGFSGAEIVAICHEAKVQTMERRIELLGLDSTLPLNDERFKVSQQDFESALSGALRRITPDLVKGYEAWRNALKG
ncbi:ATPase family protein 2 protein [Sphaceloma murrayae]|uniref:ATPase family protein 2 protein n=1 Tax=Sphaceloma murrayae TaxID=2082308 RepID=A0A2K1QLU6_9PEZI|nr:ATPase family protein 2 protein [Sphaceloma murrayae]